MDEAGHSQADLQATGFAADKAYPDNMSCDGALRMRRWWVPQT